jgi:DNA repair exonuclease SbcCD nuclease subunit
MKIAILGDTHFGVRNDSLAFHNLYKKFYAEVFFPYLEEHGIKNVYQLGDLFDRRKYISFQTLALCRKYFFDVMQRKEIQFYTLLGNHDIAFKNTLEVNSPQLLLQDYENICIFDQPFHDEELGIDIIPWICQDNEAEIQDFIKRSSAHICLGHFELAGYEMDRGNICHEGMDAIELKKYEMVLSGHFHHKSNDGHINYVGTPYEMTWSDCDDVRGFHILDTETRELTFIVNLHRMFHKIRYNDEGIDSLGEIAQADYSNLAGKYVKIVVEKKTNAFMFDTLLDEIAKVNPLDVTVVEDFTEITTEAEEAEVDQAEDTITILNKYIDGLTLPVESDKIKTLMRDVYNEAIAMETT